MNGTSNGIPDEHRRQTLSLNLNCTHRNILDLALEVIDAASDHADGETLRAHRRCRVTVAFPDRDRPLLATNLYWHNELRRWPEPFDIEESRDPMQEVP